MHQIQRDVLSEFIQHPELKEVATYHGYMGDYLLKIITRSADLVNMIEQYCKNRETDFIIKINAISGFEIYVIAKDEDVVPIKTSQGMGDRWYNK